VSTVSGAYFSLARAEGGLSLLSCSFSFVVWRSSPRHCGVLALSRGSRTHHGHGDAKHRSIVRGDTGARGGYARQLRNVVHGVHRWRHWCECVFANQSVASYPRRHLWNLVPATARASGLGRRVCCIWFRDGHRPSERCAERRVHDLERKRWPSVGCVHHVRCWSDGTSCSSSSIARCLLVFRASLSLTRGYQNQVVVLVTTTQDGPLQVTAWPSMTTWSIGATGASDITALLYALLHTTTTITTPEILLLYSSLKVSVLLSFLGALR